VEFRPEWHRAREQAVETVSKAIYSWGASISNEIEMEVVAVAAMTTERVVGTEDGVPWNYPEDVRQYKERVRDSPVIVGRITYESMLPDPPGGHQIVLSRRRRTSDSPAVTYARTANEALSVAAESGAETAYVIGGGEVYSALLGECDRMVITVVEHTVAEDTDGIVRFPAWDREKWRRARTDDSSPGFRIEFWERSG